MRFFRRKPTPVGEEAPVPGLCGLRHERYRVHWSWPGKEVLEENAFLPLLAHENMFFDVDGQPLPDDGPTIELRRDYLGPLCPHELAIIEGRDSGRSLSSQWTFTVKEL